VELEKADKIIDRYQNKQGILIQLLLDVQSEFNWIPKELIVQISERLQIPLSHIYRVASFYKGMSLTPIGRHLVQVCLGTACHVRGGPKVLDKVEEALKVNAGETTKDMNFTLRRVNCLGCCALGPVLVVDGEYHGKVTSAKVEEILATYK
jgi:NADH-quinone oxidoreductase subunit E